MADPVLQNFASQGGDLDCEDGFCEINDDLRKQEIWDDGGVETAELNNDSGKENTWNDGGTKTEEDLIKDEHFEAEDNDNEKDERESRKLDDEIHQEKVTGKMCLQRFICELQGYYINENALLSGALSLLFK